MGSKPYLLERGAEIVTLLVIELSGHCHRDWPSRGNLDSPIRQGNIDVLSSDFLDVERRAKEITDKAVKDSTFRATWISGAAVLAVPILGGIFALFTNIFTPAWSTDLEKQMAGIKEWVNVGQTQARVAKLEDDLNALKVVACRQDPLPPYCQPPGPTAPGISTKTP